jgi:hypothetical protein
VDRVRSDAVARASGTAAAGGEPAAERVVDHLLEGLSLTMDLVLDHPNHVRVERQGGSHAIIMMLDAMIVKKPSVRVRAAVVGRVSVLAA